MTVEGTDPAAKAELIAEIAQLLEDLRANRRDHIDAGLFGFWCGNGAVATVLESQAVRFPFALR